MRRSLLLALLVLLAERSHAAAPERFRCDDGTCAGSAAVTVKDTVTGLEWARTLAATNATWRASLTLCNALSLGGHDDWRLASVKELLSLFDFGSPTILPAAVFPAVPAQFVWTSTPFAGDPSLAWGAYLEHGGSCRVYDATAEVGAWCVRGGEK